MLFPWSRRRELPHFPDPFLDPNLLKIPRQAVSRGKSRGMRAQGACRQRCQPSFITAPELQPFPLLFRVPFHVNSSRWELQGPRCVQRMIPEFGAPLWKWNCAGKIGRAHV